MAQVHRIQVVHSGFPGAPGYTSFHFVHIDASTAATQFTAVRAFLGQTAGGFPSFMSSQVQPAGTVLEETTGELIGFTAAVSPATDPQGGTANGGLGSGVSGLCIGLNTLTINRTRKIRGRIFMVPLCAAAYESDGTIIPGFITEVTTAANNLVTAGLHVWSRPRPPAADGKIAAVITTRVRDRAAFLSSRRS